MLFVENFDGVLLAVMYTDVFTFLSFLYGLLLVILVMIPVGQCVPKVRVVLGFLLLVFFGVLTHVQQRILQ
jgi:hypothetical protein